MHIIVVSRFYCSGKYTYYRIILHTINFRTRRCIDIDSIMKMMTIVREPAPDIGGLYSPNVAVIWCGLSCGSNGHLKA